jgi:hypothetical protein
MMKAGLVLFSVLLITCGAVSAEDAEKPDTAAIKAAVADYLEGWFSSDPARMERAFHPNLAKFNVRKVGKTDREYLASMTRDELVAMAHHNQEWVKDKKFHDMKILHQDHRLAVVHAISDGFYDLCNLAKINGEWKIVQVLWDRNDLGGK